MAKPKNVKELVVTFLTPGPGGIDVEIEGRIAKDKIVAVHPSTISADVVVIYTTDNRVWRVTNKLDYIFGNI